MIDESRRITSLTTDPHAVSLADQECVLFIDPKSGEILFGNAVFSPANKPIFCISSVDKRNWLALDYCGARYLIGYMADDAELRRWTESANAFLEAKITVTYCARTVATVMLPMVRRRVELSGVAGDTYLCREVVPAQCGRVEMPIEYEEC